MVASKKHDNIILLEDIKEHNVWNAIAEKREKKGEKFILHDDAWE